MLALAGGLIVASEMLRTGQIRPLAGGGREETCHRRLANL